MGLSKKKLNVSEKLVDDIAVIDYKIEDIRETLDLLELSNDAILDVETVSVMKEKNQKQMAVIRTVILSLQKLETEVMGVYNEAWTFHRSLREQYEKQNCKPVKEKELIKEFPQLKVIK